MAQHQNDDSCFIQTISNCYNFTLLSFLCCSWIATPLAHLAGIRQRVHRKAPDNSVLELYYTTQSRNPTQVHVAETNERLKSDWSEFRLETFVGTETWRPCLWTSLWSESTDIRPCLFTTSQRLVGCPRRAVCQSDKWNAGSEEDATRTVPESSRSSERLGEYSFTMVLP